MKISAIILTLAAFLTGYHYGDWKCSQAGQATAAQYRNLYHQAIIWQQTTIPHKTRQFNLVWKVKG